MSKTDWSDAEATITVVGHRTRPTTSSVGGGLTGLLTQLAAKRPTPEPPPATTCEEPAAVEPVVVEETP